jgi:hypothetical protein
LWEDISIDEESKAFTVLIGELSVEDLEVLWSIWQWEIGS